MFKVIKSPERHQWRLSGVIVVNFEHILHLFLVFLLLTLNKSMLAGMFRVNIRLKPATLLKLTLLHGCFSLFLNCTNVTKRATHHKYLNVKIVSKKQRITNSSEDLQTQDYDFKIWLDLEHIGTINTQNQKHLTRFFMEVLFSQNVSKCFISLKTAFVSFYRGVFTTQSNIYDGTFWKYS